MNQTTENILSLYDYELPSSAIANEPAEPRDSAKLLVYDRAQEQVSHAIFRDLLDHLPKGTLLVMNQTKVIPARIELHKESGGKIELLYTRDDDTFVYALCDKRLAAGAKLQRDGEVWFEVVDKIDSEFKLKPTFNVSEIIKRLEKYGNPPLPPYIKDSPLDRNEQLEKYQTVFAKEYGSVAAPTASLHFTDELLERLQGNGIEIAFVTLHVGLGTFASVKEENLEENRLHQELYEVSPTAAEAINRAKREGRPVIAVGTTSVRTVESVAGGDGLVKAATGSTDLFIREGYNFKTVDGMITNFHVPKSSLLMLVSAFAGREKILSLYKEAIEKEYRFFSFGDAMLIV